MMDLKIGDRVRFPGTTWKGRIICAEHSASDDPRFRMWRVRLDPISIAEPVIEQVVMRLIFEPIEEEGMKAATIELVPRPTAEDPIQVWLKEAKAPEYREVEMIAWRPTLDLWQVGITTGIAYGPDGRLGGPRPWNQDYGGFGRTLEAAWAQAMYYLAAGDAIYAAEYPEIAQQKARGL